MTDRPIMILNTNASTEDEAIHNFEMAFSIKLGQLCPDASDWELKVICCEKTPYAQWRYQVTGEFEIA